MHTIEYIALAVFMLVAITYRQTRWHSVGLTKLLVMPAVLVVAALAMLQTSARLLPADWHLSGPELVLVAVELGLGVVGGLLMGRWADIRTVDGTVTARVTGRGLAVWIGFLVVRISLGVLGSGLGAPLSSMPSTIMVVLAVVKVAQAVVIRSRVAQQATAHNELPLAPPTDTQPDQHPRFPAGV